MQVIFRKKNANDTDRTYNIDEGSVYIENYNETLDSATIRISNLSSQINIEPFDKVILVSDKIGNKYMLVDTFTETMSSLDPVLYSYEISLFSETKELENYSLPNLSITQLTNSSHRTVWYYLTHYLDLYGPKLRTEYNGTYDFWSKYFWRNNAETNHPKPVDKFNIDCPEMQWNNPTLREVLTDLMMVVDCIPILRNDELDYIDLTQKKNPIDTSKVNYIQRSQSAEDYVSELKMDMQNVMQTSVNGVKNSCNRVEWLTFRAEDDGYVVTENNMCLRTQFPIMNIKHLWMLFETVNKNNGEKTLYKIDLCHGETQFGAYIKLVYEQTEYNALPLRRYNPGNFTEINQNMSVYFKRGSNVITGFNTLSKQSWTFSGKTTALQILKTLIPQNCYDINHEIKGGISVAIGSVWYSTFFQIEYETTTDSVFTASKSLAPTHQRIIIDNQTNSYVDAYNQGFMEYQKANRLGNHQLFINARYENDYEHITKIGDYYNDSVIFQVRYQIYEHHVEINATATKDYILRDYFTGVKAKIRSWKIADGNEALVRHDLNKFYMEFSFNRKREAYSANYNIAHYFMSPLYSVAVEPVNYCIAYMTDSNNTIYPVGSYEPRYGIDLIGRIIGNSIVYNFGCDDNFLVGKRVCDDIAEAYVEPTVFNLVYEGQNYAVPFRLDTSFMSNYGGVPLQSMRYVDNNGEFYKIYYQFVTKIDQSPTLENFNSWSDNDEKQFMVYCCLKPMVYQNAVYNNVVFAEEKVIEKDNREITKLSTQFEFCTDTNDIVFTKKFLELQKCIRESQDMYYTGGSLVLRLRVGLKNAFDFRNPDISNTTNIGSNVNISLTSILYTNELLELINYTLPTGYTVGNSAFYITYLDNNGDEQLLLAFTGHDKIYLNVLKSRDYNVYNEEQGIIRTID